jgi:phage head maturation protease
MDHFICPFEVKAGSTEDDGCITGYGSVFGNVDSYGDIVAKGAFKKTILDSKTAVTSWPAMLLQHGGTSVDDRTPRSPSCRRLSTRRRNGRRRWKP